MPSSSGPRNIAKSNLVFALDTYDTSNCVTPLGCGGWNTSTQGIKNILTGATALYQNGLRISNRTFYTAFGISYPEGNYGGDAAGRQGLGLGYNVRSGGNVYGAGRSLHLWVWNNDTNSWIEGYFNGTQLGGHCYDNYGGAEIGWPNALNAFNADFAKIKQLFPNSTFIVLGSHACQCFDSTTIDNMVSLGAPRSTISSWTNNADWREFVLVGKPGLGDGNAYGWAYENYSTNPGQVAHMNLSVTPRNTGVLEFDGTDDFLNLGNLGSIGSSYTIECVFNSSAVTSYKNVFDMNYGTFPATGNVGPRLEQMSDGTFTWVWSGNTSNSLYNYTPPTPISPNVYYHAVFTLNNGIVNTYKNGVLIDNMVSSPQGYITNFGTVNIGRGFMLDPGRYFQGKIGVTNIYNSALTATEVQNNYRQYKTRFNLS